MDPEDEEIVKPPPMPKLFHIFVNNVNTKVGHSILEKIGYPYEKNEDDYNTILATKCAGSDLCVPEIVKKIVDPTDLRVMKEVLQDSDVIIYDLQNSKFEDVEFAIKTLKINTGEKQKILILISSVLVWAQTPPRERKDEEEEGGEEVVEGEDDDDEEDKAEDEKEAEEKARLAEKNKAEDQEEEVPKVYVPHSEKLYKYRKTYPRYENMKTLETLCLSAGRSNANLKTYVLCSGILYGKGEDTFNPLFKVNFIVNI